MMKSFIIHVRFLFFFLFIIIILCSCGKSEIEKVDILNKTFEQGNYRKVIIDYKKLITELSDTSEIKRAKEIFADSKIIVDKADSLISLVDSISNYGFNLPAWEYVKEANKLFPKDSIVNSFLKKIPENKNPMYKISDVYNSAKFIYIFHTKWIKEELLPVSVDITVVNLNPYTATAIAYYVPSFYYVDVGNFGYRVLVVHVTPELWETNSKINKPIFCNQSFTCNVSYSNVEYTRENTNISLATVFRKIIFGKDARFYLNIVGTRSTRFSGLSFIGYE
jgi:hypothetical protein